MYIFLSLKPDRFLAWIELEKRKLCLSQPRFVHMPSTVRKMESTLCVVNIVQLPSGPKTADISKPVTAERDCDLHSPQRISPQIRLSKIPNSKMFCLGCWNTESPRQPLQKSRIITWGKPITQSQGKDFIQFNNGETIPSSSHNYILSHFKTKIHRRVSISVCTAFLQLWLKMTWNSSFLICSNQLPCFFAN